MFTVGWILASPVLRCDSVPVVVGETLPAVLDDVLQYCVGHVSYLVFVEPFGFDDAVYGVFVCGGGFECDAHNAGLSSCMKSLKDDSLARRACVICWSVQSGCCCFR